MGNLIRGKPVADAIKEGVKSEVKDLRSKGIIPKLTIIRVGTDPGDMSYERGALKVMSNLNIDTEVKALPENVTQEEFIDLLKRINDDSSTHGILILRPLPKQLDENIIKNIIDPKKDVDCFSPI